MTQSKLISQILFFGFYLLLQIFFVRQLVLFNYAFCFVYIATIVLLDFDTSPTALVLIAFFSGLFIDVFYNTLGMHAASNVFIAFLRPTILTLLTPRRGYDERMTLSLSSMGFQWIVIYLGTMAFIHHFILFMMEASDLGLFLQVLVKTICTTILTTFVVILLQFFRK